MPESTLRLATGDGHLGRETPLRFPFQFSKYEVPCHWTTILVGRFE
jgi:hypothetical protein